METLPPELHLMIFQLLPVPDTIRLRLVSRSWNHLLNCLKHDSLAVFDQDPDGIFDYLGEVSRYHLDVMEFQPTNSVVCRDENLLLTTPLSSMFQSVRKLKTNFYSHTILQMSKFYNQFRELEELTCFHYSYWSSGITIILNLPRLNKLIVRKGDASRFDLRTPCLTHLEIISFRQCDLYYPDRLKRLEANLYEHREIDFTKLTNLKTLIVNGSDWTLITNSFLAKMKSLKEIHFYANDWLTRDAMNLSYRRDGIKLYLFGFDIDKAPEILEDERFPFGSEEDEARVIARNYERAAETVYKRIWIEYNQLTRTGLNKGFFAKFPRLGMLKVSGQVENEDALLEFLMKAKPPRFMMENHLFSQRFLSRMALQCDFIRKIDLKNLHLDLMGPDSEFIFSMKSLAKISIFPPQVSLDFALKAFEHLNQLTELHFSIDDYYGGCNFSTYCLCLGLKLDEENDGLYTYLKSRSRDDLVCILRSLQRELKSNNCGDLKEMILLIENYRNNQILVEDLVMKLTRNQLYCIYC